MSSPADRKYSDSHEWFKASGDVVTVGVTQHAVDQLTDITYAEMKPKGTSVAPGGTIGEIESVKATSDIYSAVGGEIIEVNPALAEDPGVLNSDPYEKGWLVKIRAKDLSALNALHDSKAYDAANHG